MNKIAVSSLCFLGAAVLGCGQQADANGGSAGATHMASAGAGAKSDGGSSNGSGGSGPSTSGGTSSNGGTSSASGGSTSAGGSAHGGSNSSSSGGSGTGGSSVGTAGAPPTGNGTDVIVTIKNGGYWNDTAGNRIEAHGAGVIRVGDTWYWIGEDKSGNSGGFKAVNCYASKDLSHWEFRRAIITKQTSTDLAASDRIIERPKVIYNE